MQKGKKGGGEKGEHDHVEMGSGEGRRVKPGDRDAEEDHDILKNTTRTQEG